MKIEKNNLSLEDIQIDVGDNEFKKAMAIYQDNKIGDLQESPRGYSAKIKGTSIYNVSIDKYAYDRGDYSCYLGQKNVLCKHMVALAIAMVYKDYPDNLDLINIPLDRAVCSGEVREITEEETLTFNEEIKTALACLKSYRGPSSKWFEYQDSLIKGLRLTLLATSKIPVCEKSVLLCIDLPKSDFYDFKKDFTFLQ